MAAIDAEELPASSSRPPAGLIALIERFDPDVIDVPSGSARIRLKVDGESEWDAVIDAGAIDLQPASDSQPDAVVSSDAVTWDGIVRDVRGGMVAFREGRMSNAQVIRPQAGEQQRGRSDYARRRGGRGHTPTVRGKSMLAIRAVLAREGSTPILAIRPGRASSRPRPGAFRRSGGLADARRGRLLPPRLTGVDC
jgi:hypothetical protein